MCAIFITKFFANNDYRVHNPLHEGNNRPQLYNQNVNFNIIIKIAISVIAQRSLGISLVIVHNSHLHVENLVNSSCSHHGRNLQTTTISMTRTQYHNIHNFETSVALTLPSILGSSSLWLWSSAIGKERSHNASAYMHNMQATILVGVSSCCPQS